MVVHIEWILPNISDCPVASNKERQQIFITLFAPANHFEEDESDEESEAADDD